MVLPSVDKMVQVIAIHDKAEVFLFSMTALNTIGLSTQVPINYTYLTTGSERTIKLSNRNVILKRFKRKPQKGAAKFSCSFLYFQLHYFNRSSTNTRNCSARIFLARMRLFSSNTKIQGTASTLYIFTTSHFHPFSEET